MKTAVYRSTLMNSIWWRNAWMVMALLLACGNLALLYWLYHKDLAERTVLIPPDIRQSFWIKGDSYSESYLSEMAHYFSQLTLSYSPKSIDYQHAKVLEYVSPTVYEAIAQKLLVDAKAVKEKNVTAVFYPTDAKVLGLRVAVRGTWRYNIKGDFVEERQIVWRIDFEKRAGRLLVTRFFEVGKDEEIFTKQAPARAHDNKLS